MIIIYGSEKGGVGKSTTAINHAVYLQSQGKSLILVDADKQENVKDWCDDRDEAGLPSIPCVQKLGNIKNTLLELSRHYEYVLCDIGGRDSYEWRTGLMAANINITPFKCSQFDLNTIEKVKAILMMAKDFNEDLRIVSYLNMCSTNPKVKEIQESRSLFDEYEELNLLDINVSFRKIFCDVLPDGKSIFEAKNKDAIEEMTSLFNNII